MDLIQVILIHSVVVGGFLVVGTIAKISAGFHSRRSRWSSRSIQKFGFIAVTCLAASGCGGNSSRIAVEGEVTLGGEPISAGSIVFKPAFQEKGFQVGTKIVDGKYRFTRDDGPIPARYRVEIYEDEKNPFPLDDPQAFAEQMDKDPSKVLPNNRVPETYNRQSTLTAEPSADQTQFNFHLKTSQP